MEPNTKEQTDYILVSNELIAKFMGYTVSHKRYPRNHGIGAPEIVDNQDCIREKLKYHRDWNKLIDVWFKFRDMRFPEVKHQFEHGEFKQLISHSICYSSIDETYRTLVDAISWYNSTKQ